MFEKIYKADNEIKRKRARRVFIQEDFLKRKRGLTEERGKRMREREMGARISYFLLLTFYLKKKKTFCLLAFGINFDE